VQPGNGGLHDSGSAPFCHPRGGREPGPRGLRDPSRPTPGALRRLPVDSTSSGRARSSGGSERRGPHPAQAPQLQGKFECQEVDAERALERTMRREEILVVAEGFANSRVGLCPCSSYTRREAPHDWFVQLNSNERCIPG